jgi:hypothetical protein
LLLFDVSLQLLSMIFDSFSSEPFKLLFVEERLRNRQTKKKVVIQFKKKVISNH